MEVLNYEDYDNDTYLKRVYTLNDNVQVDSFINIVRGFENEHTKMSLCNCQSFDGDGHPMYRRYTTIDDIFRVNDFPNPYIRFYVEFCDRMSEIYKFNLEANVNSNIVTYIVDKNKWLMLVKDILVKKIIKEQNYYK